MKTIDVLMRVVLVPLDALAVCGAFIAAYLLRSEIHSIAGITLYEGTLIPFRDFLLLVVIGAVGLVGIFALHGLYAIRTTQRFLREVPRIIWASLTWVLAAITWFFLTRELFFSRFVLVVGFLLMILAIVLERGFIRYIQRFLLRAGVGTRRVLLIGDTPVALRLVQGLQQNIAYTFAGIVDYQSPQAHYTALPRLGSFDAIESVLKEHAITDLILTINDVPQQRIEELLYFCQEHHVAFFFLPTLYELHRSEIVTTEVVGMPLIELRPTPLEGWGRVWKRLFDIIFSSVWIILLAIPALVMAIIIKIDSRGPVFVKLRRINQGTVFYMYKFRSMVDGAEQMKKDLLRLNERSGPLFKIKNDPRITRIGRILRKTRIDELPQLINVLKGDMSMVGPRPHEPEEVSRYTRQHRRVLGIKPGVTGLAQVSGASDLDFDEEVRLDTYYIERWSLWMDLSIIIRTVGIVLQGKGAA